MNFLLFLHIFSEFLPFFFKKKTFLKLLLVLCNGKGPLQDGCPVTSWVILLRCSALLGQNFHILRNVRCGLISNPSQLRNSMVLIFITHTFHYCFKHRNQGRLKPLTESESSAPDPLERKTILPQCGLRNSAQGVRGGKSELRP